MAQVHGPRLCALLVVAALAVFGIVGVSVLPAGSLTCDQTVTTASDAAAHTAMTAMNSANGGTLCFSVGTSSIALTSTLAYTGTGPLTILGNGVTLSGGGTVQILTSGQPLTVDGVTFTGGHAADHGGAVAVNDAATISNSSFVDNSAGCATVCQNASGGALSTNDGSATITNSTFSGNTATSGTSDACASLCTSQGGAVSVDGSATVTSSTFTGNAVSTDSCTGGFCRDKGGAVWTFESFTSTASTFANNTASCAMACSAEGAGVFTGELAIGKAASASDVHAAVPVAPSVTVTSSHFTGNSATATCEVALATCEGDGGGIYVGRPEAIGITTSTFDHNTVSYYGSAISVGAVVTPFTMTLTNSTVTQNTGMKGGAIDASDAGNSLDLAYDTIVANTSTDSAEPSNLEVGAVLTAFGSIIAQGSGGPNCAIDGSTTSQGYNWSDDTSCQLTDAHDTVTTPNDPQLNALGDWGGPTPTMLPDTPLHGGVTSPVIDAIPNAACETGIAAGITTDQRGVSRPQMNGCDIGAVEVQSSEFQVSPEAVVLQPMFTG